MNLYQAISQQCQRYADKPALVLPQGQVWTYQELQNKTLAIAHLFQEKALLAGERVLVQTDKSPWSLCVYLACLATGLVYVPLNLDYKDELEYFISDATPSLFVCEPEKHAFVSQLSANVQTLAVDGSGTLLDGLDLSQQAMPHQSNEEDIALMLYTSGTTGLAKGAMLTHGGLLANANALATAWQITHKDTLLHALPIFHAHGLFIACHPCLLKGATMIFLEKFSTQAIMHYLPEANILMGVPTYYTRLLAEPDFTPALTKHMRLFISGSAPLLPQTFAAFTERTGQSIVERYGMTETGVNTTNPVEGARKQGTVGLPLADLSLRIVDESDQVLPKETIGHIQVKGPSLLKGYWQKPDKTQESFTADGYFRTGDMGAIDQDGYLTISGREKDMIISGGLNVYPKEIELLLDQHPDIQESAVIGVPHADFGEAVAAVIVPSDSSNAPDAEAIQDYVKQKLAGFKVPKSIYFVDSLPRNAMSKVQKHLLREQYSL